MHTEGSLKFWDLRKSRASTEHQSQETGGLSGKVHGGGWGQVVPGIHRVFPLTQALQGAVWGPVITEFPRGDH